MDQKQKVFQHFRVPDPVRIQKVKRFAYSYFGNLKGMHILECGACEGGLAEILSREGAHCYGIDINVRNIPGVKIYQADLNLEFPEFTTSFDIVFAGETIEHLYDDAKFIRQSKTFLKPGGLLILTVPNIGYTLNRLLLLFGQLPMFAYAPFHYHIYNDKSILNLVKSEGFEVVKLSSSHILFSSRRNRLGKIFEILGDAFPFLGAHLIVYAKKI